MHSRDSQEIIAEILRGSLSSVNLTRIIYKVCLSYAQTKKYLQLLQKNDLIKYDNGIKLYVTTDKGKKYLQIYDEIAQSLSRRQLENIKEMSYTPENKR